MLQFHWFFFSKSLLLLLVVVVVPIIVVVLFQGAAGRPHVPADPLDASSPCSGCSERGKDLFHMSSGFQNIAFMGKIVDA